MIHFGDITKISGYTAPIVDCVVGGSPCQDLSVAGRRAGLDGERSGLFMEQIRIIKEMRENDRRTRNVSDVDVRPRYMLWENVPGAFSSNKGDDFRVVLEETAKIAKDSVVIPRPENGKWANAGCIRGDGWSIAWRVFDAQFWGVPQRRRRIALVADFGGQSAPEILFVRKSVSGNIEQSRAKRKDSSATAKGSTGVYDRPSISFQERGGKPGGGKGILIQDDRTGALSTLQNQYVVDKVVQVVDMGGGKSQCGIYDGLSPTLTCTHGGEPVVTYSVENHPADSRVCIDKTGKVQTLTSRMGTGGGNVPMVMQCFRKQGHPRNSEEGQGWEETDTSDTLNVFDNTETRTPTLIVDQKVYGVCSRYSNSMLSDNPNSGFYEAETSRTLDHNGSNPTSNQGKNAQYDFYAEETETMPTVIAKGPGAVAYKNVKYIVRRLTPLECEWLQGYPDGWTDIGEYVDTNGKVRKTSDSARYKALGNSIALPSWKWVLKRLCSCYERDATMASLFDGIGGFPYLWEQINGHGSCLWASEIEEFPIAVTKKRINGGVD